MRFTVDVAVTFAGLVAALFVATLIIKSLESRKRTSTGTLVTHFFNFIGTSVLLLAVIAGETTIEGAGAFWLWLLGVVSTGGFLWMLALDLKDRRTPAPKASGNPHGWRGPKE